MNRELKGGCPHGYVVGREQCPACGGVALPTVEIHSPVHVLNQREDGPLCGIPDDDEVFTRNVSLMLEPYACAVCRAMLMSLGYHAVHPKPASERETDGES